MLEELKKKALKSRLVIIVILLAGGLGLLAYGFTALVALIRGPVQLYDLTADELEGAYVEADVDMLLDVYAETVERKSGSPDRVSWREYVMPVQDAIIGLELPSSMLADADAVMDDTYDWLMDETGTVYLGARTVSVRGTIQKMDEETQAMFAEYTEGWEMEEYCLPLVLTQNTLGDLEPNMHWLVLGGALLMLVLGIWLLVSTLTGGAQQGIKRYVAACPDGNDLWGELDEFYRGTPTEHGLKCDRRWLLYDHGTSCFLLAADDIVWVYFTVTTHRRGLIVTGKTYTVTVCGGREKKGAARHTIDVASEQKARELMDYLHGWYPDAVYGYSDAFEAAYRKDPAAFRRDFLEARRRAAEQAARTVTEEALADGPDPSLTPVPDDQDPPPAPAPIYAEPPRQ